MQSQELEIYRRTVLNKLKELYESIPNTKDNAPVQIELIGRQTLVLTCHTKEEIEVLANKKLLYHIF